MIKAEHITKIFKSKGRENVIALKDVSFSLNDKGLVFITGKSGSGKSTLLNILSGFDDASQGHVFFNNQDIAAFKNKELDDYHFCKIGFIFQNYSLIENLTVEENIALSLKTKPSLIKEEIDSVLKDVLLQGYQKRKIKNLSGGEKQRVAIARALIKNPKVIFCDEPTGNLDYKSSKAILSILKQKSKDILIVLVSHNLNQAYLYGDRILQLEDGKLISDLSFDEKSKKDDEIYLSNLDEMEEEEIKDLNDMIRQNHIHTIKARKDLFHNTELKETTFPYDDKIVKFHLRSKSTLFKIVNKNKLRLFLISFCLSLTMSLFSCIYSLSAISKEDYVSNIVDNHRQDTFFIQNSINKKNGSPYNTCIRPISNTFKERIDKMTLKGECYPVYKLPFHCQNYTGDQSSLDANVSSELIIFSEFYSKSSSGLMIAKESSLGKILKVDEISYLAKAENQRDDGVFMTDYFADSFLFYNPSKKTYQDLLGFLSDSGYKTYNARNKLYINGIIKTDYKARLSNLKRELEKDSNPLILLEDRYSYEYNYLLHGLNYFYSFNEDCMKLMNEDMNSSPMVYSNMTNFRISSASTNNLPMFLSYSEGIEDGSLVMIDQSFVDVFNIDKKDILDRTNQINDTGGLNLSLCFYSISEKHYEAFYEKTFQLLSKDSIPSFNHLKKGSEAFIYLSKNEFREIRKKERFCFGYEFTDIKDAKNVMRELKEEPVLLASNLYYINSKIDSGMYRFKNIFLLFSFVSLSMTILLILYYALSIVRSQYYNLSLLQSLGYKRGEISLIYLAHILFFTFLTSISYYLTYQTLFRRINLLLVRSIFKVKTNFYLTVLTFSKPFFYFSLLSTLFSITFIVILYLWLLRRKKSVMLLQNKE